MYRFLTVVSACGEKTLCEEVQWTLSVLFHHLRLPHDTNLNVHLVSAQAMHYLNRTYKLVDKPTDVLTFPDNDTALLDRFGQSAWQHVLAPVGGASPSAGGGVAACDVEDSIFSPLGDYDADDDFNESLHLGEMFISVACMRDIAASGRGRDLPLQQYFIAALVHAFCHALGYDHRASADHAEMVKMEKRLVRHLQIRLSSAAARRETLYHESDSGALFCLPTSFSLRSKNRK
jgi:ssRNA-specific RNase YbeY (16S rRNA maturation enzyme)